MVEDLHAVDAASDLVWIIVQKASHLVGDIPFPLDAPENHLPYVPCPNDQDLSPYFRIFRSREDLTYDSVKKPRTTQKNEDDKPVYKENRPRESYKVKKKANAGNKKQGTRSDSLDDA
jgi:hypothetical protein